MQATGQLAGVTRMVEDGRDCIDVLDWPAAVTAAVDAIALAVLTNHIHAVQSCIECSDADDKAAELVVTVRRYVRSR